MTIVQAPCSSIEAHGTIANTTTYAKLRRTAYTKAHFTPSNPQSDAQTATRLMRQWLITTWATLTAAEKAAWEALAENYRLSPYHAFLKINCRRWASDLLPQKTPVIGNPCAWTQYTSVWKSLETQYRANCSIKGEPSQPFCAELLCSTTQDFTPAKSLVKVISSGWYWYAPFWRLSIYFDKPDSQQWYCKTRYSTQSGATSRYFPTGTFYP